MEINLVKFEGKGFEKLISTVSGAIGIVYEPTRIKRDAKAKAEELKIIADANREIRLKDIEADEDIKDKIAIRTAQREIKRQYNIDNIIKYAASDIANENDVSDKPVDEDWITRFFNYAQDISNEDAQLLWGKLLSNEVKKPGSFSLRTIEILRNISPSEAQLFQSICEFVFLNIEKSIGFIYNESKVFENAISYNNLLILKESGLVDISFLAHTSKNVFFHSIYNRKLLYAVKKGQKIEVEIPVYNLTQSGLELFKINSQKTNQAYFDDFIKYFKETYKPDRIRYGEYKYISNNEVQFINSDDL